MTLMTDLRKIEHKNMTPEALFHRAIKTHLNKRQHSVNYARGEKCPPTLEAAQAA